jgi:hypothetical protein
MPGERDRDEERLADAVLLDTRRQWRRGQTRAATAMLESRGAISIESYKAKGDGADASGEFCPPICPPAHQ